MERDFKGIWIPKKIWLDKDLSASEKVLIAEIDSLDCGEGCWANNKYLSFVIGKAEQTVANILARLVKQGVVVAKVDCNGTKRMLSISPMLTEIGNESADPYRNRESKVSNLTEIGKPYNNSSNTLQQNITTSASPSGQVQPQEACKSVGEPIKDERPNWDNCHSDLQKFIAFYIRNWNETLYKYGTKEQVSAFYKTYGKMFSQMLGVAGSLEIACNTIVYFDRHFKKEGWSWNLKTLTTNFPEFVNYSMQKQKEGECQ